MNKTQKLEFQNELETYLEKNKIFDLFQYMNCMLAKDKPKKPIKYLIKLLGKEESMKIVIIGLPGSQRKEYAKEIADKLGIKNIISSGRLILNEIKKDTEIGRQIKDAYYSSMFVKDEIVTPMVKQEIDKLQEDNESWILEGFPRNRAQAINLQKWGIFVDSFFKLDFPKELTFEFLRKRFSQPGEYKDTFEKLSPSKDLELHVNNVFLACKVNCPAATEMNKGFYFQIKITKNFNDNLNSMLNIINFKLKYRGPNRPPRIFILGPSGSGRSTIAQKLSEKYGLVYVSTSKLLQDEIAKKSSIGMVSAEVIKDGELIPDDQIMNIIEKRLNESDCLVNGWILDNFPRTESQINLIKNLKLHPSLVIILHVDEKVCCERIEGRKIDPETGKTYNVKKEKINDQNVEKRLINIDQDKIEVLKKRFASWKQIQPKIESIYKDKLAKIRGDQSLEIVLDEICHIIDESP